MEDGEYLSQEDKNKMQALKSEWAALQIEHKKFAKMKGGLGPENKEKWRLNSERCNQINVELKELRFKNVFGVTKPKL